MTLAGCAACACAVAGRLSIGVTTVTVAVNLLGPAVGNFQVIVYVIHAYYRDADVVGAGKKREPMGLALVTGVGPSKKLDVCWPVGHVLVQLLAFLFSLKEY